MTKLLFTLIFLLLGFGSLAQISFEPGYFILANGHKTECLIRNPDKNNNPTSFEYKISEGSEIQIASLDSVVSFEILNTVHKYHRHLVKIDRSLNDLNNLPAEKEILSKEESLFLRVLVDGQASLYAYYGRNGLKKFFYNMKAEPVEQLVHYKYLTNDNKVGENMSFISQLSSKLSCNSFIAGDFENLRYEEKYLTALFTRYNKCVGSDYLDQTKKRGKGIFSFVVKAGLNAATLKMKQFVGNRSFESAFGQAISPLIALEMEYTFPSNKNKWSMLFEPTFQSYKKTSKVAVYNYNSTPSNPGGLGGGWVDLSVNYSHIALPIGVRHHFFLNDKSKPFLNGAVSYNILLNPSEAFQFENKELYPSFKHERVHMVPAFILGGGYEFNGKFRIESAYQFGKTMADNDNFKTSFSKSFTVAIGYKIK